MGCFKNFCSDQDVRPFLSEKGIKRGSKKRELDALIRNYIQEKAYTILEMCECEWRRLEKTTTKFKQHVLKNFPHKLSLTDYQLLEKVKNGNLFD